MFLFAGVRGAIATTAYYSLRAFGEYVRRAEYMWNTDVRSPFINRQLSLCWQYQLVLSVQIAVSVILPSSIPLLFLPVLLAVVLTRVTASTATSIYTSVSTLLPVPISLLSLYPIQVLSLIHI